MDAEAIRFGEHVARRYTKANPKVTLAVAASEVFDKYMNATKLKSPSGELDAAGEVDEWLATA